MDCLVVGCGLSGAVIARQLAEQGKRVAILERRGHIGGNMYDYVDRHGFLVQKYGPHTFHTEKRELYDYVCRFAQWQDFKLTCGSVWDGKYTPAPFNFTTIDTFYPPEMASALRAKLQKAFAGREFASVVEVLQHPDPDIRAYAEYLFQKDYAPYTAKQWGIEPWEVDLSVLRRVPLRFSYNEGYFKDPWQVLPKLSFTAFFQSLLDHPNITVELNTEALSRLSVRENALCWNGGRLTIPVVYTGALDELFDHVYGVLPYRSLRFEWMYSRADSLQPDPVVAYPQEKGYTRITEYKKLPPQTGPGTSYAVEYPLAYQKGKHLEPYYPVVTAESRRQYERYRRLAESVPGLVFCGRLADFQYYDMDQALERALNVSQQLT